VGGPAILKQQTESPTSPDVHFRVAQRFLKDLQDANASRFLRGTRFPKEAPEGQLFSERPSGSFTSGGFPKEANVLREASPLAAFRRKPKEAEGSELVLKKARPSAI